MQEVDREIEAEEKFKEIAIAYAVLSDPKERSNYNQFGIKSSNLDERNIDPEEIFSTYACLALAVSRAKDQSA